MQTRWAGVQHVAHHNVQGESTSMRTRMLPHACHRCSLWGHRATTTLFLCLRQSGVNWKPKPMVMGPAGGKAGWRKRYHACPPCLCSAVRISLPCFPFCSLKHSSSCQSKSLVGKPSSKRLYANTLKSEHIAGDVCCGSRGCVWPVAFQLESAD